MDNKAILKKAIEEDPLYHKREFGGDFLEEDSNLLVIEYYCPNCNKLKTFHRKNSPPQRGSDFGGTGSFTGEITLISSTIHYNYQCTYCGTKINFWIELNAENNWLRKIGQNPPWSIELSDDLKRYLHENEELYKKGLICLSQSFGLGACSYFRRIIENEINPLLTLLIEQKKIEGEGKDKVEEYKDIKDGKSFTAKTKLAYEITPQSLIVKGTNPFKKLHDFLSQGIHSKDEEECVKIALNAKHSLEFVVIELNREKENRKSFRSNINDINN
jgi:hypothetical protein